MADANQDALTQHKCDDSPQIVMLYFNNSQWCRMVQPEEQPLHVLWETEEKGVW